ncbi:hypothetical protein AUQ37_08385 [Candidatus Methanomethylophilus sp. 1R26]|uniref:hypothetical protein n=1 Tax=Candidatus Methanomethylophilus sp. 1R26 TaxID=1769296 RepID=UPI00073715AC|nr:hypothetical protein [Candidatus Methanomethylophilus sp. 1R26]KUE73666.1 hypothetical protein AUQ37_08385 [Candidatus Methanomethylophilus sp. 1R26]
METRVLVKLDRSSPKSAEQLLILASKGYIDVSEATGTFMGCRDDMDVDMSPEDAGVRDVAPSRSGTPAPGRGTSCSTGRGASSAPRSTSPAGSRAGWP